MKTVIEHLKAQLSANSIYTPDYEKQIDKLQYQMDELRKRKIESELRDKELQDAINVLEATVNTELYKAVHGS